MLLTWFRWLLKRVSQAKRGRIFAEVAATMDGGLLVDAIRRVALTRTETLPVEEALRFLFHLDAHLYALQGRHAKRYDHGVHSKHRHTGYHDFFIGRISRGESVVDIGCGGGMLTFDLAAKAGAQVLGIELNADKIAEAREKFSHPGVTYQHGDVLHDLPEQRFDVAVLSNVLEHLAGRVDFLRRLQVVAQPARFLIRVPLYQRDWRVPLKHELGVEWRLDPTHEIEYTQESFQAEMELAGLTLTHQEFRWGEIWAEAVSANQHGGKTDANQR